MMDRAELLRKQWAIAINQFKTGNDIALLDKLRVEAEDAHNQYRDSLASVDAPV